MAWLLLGVGIGATAVALSEADRGYYDTARLSMDYLGNKNGMDIYKDRVTGFYYADDGWDVRRVGKAGWSPHPIDLERLKSKLSQYSPGQVKFSGYILATYIGKEQQLWDTIFKRYEMPKEPKKPHFGKGIRKQRWAKYDEEYDAWQKAVAVAKSKYKSECEKWRLKKDAYQASNGASAGRDLLHRALSGTPSSNARMFKLTVPRDKKPGDMISVQAGDEVIEVLIPSGAAPGTEIQFEIPASKPIPVAQESNYAAPVQNYSAPVPPPATGAPQPAKPTTSNVNSRPPAPAKAPAPAPAGPPPAIGQSTSFDTSFKL